MEKGVNRVITIKWPRTLFLQRWTAPRSGRFRRNEVRRKIYDRILYATAKLRASWGGARTMLSSRSRDEWESAVRILIPWLKFARRSSIRSSESFERLRQRRESCLIRWGEKSRWKWYIVSPHLGQFISIPFIFFFSLLVWFFIRQNYFYDLKTRFWKRVTLNTEKIIILEMIFFVRRRLDEKFEIFEI